MADVETVAGRSWARCGRCGLWHEPRGIEDGSLDREIDRIEWYEKANREGRA